MVSINSSDSLFIALSSLVTGTLVYIVWKRPHSRPNFPPGPPGLPILGNIFDIPADEPWVTFQKLGDKYGDLVHFHVLTQDVIILNSHEAVKDLFEVRSQNYSDRPYIPGNDMLDFSWITGFLPYGEKLKTHRKTFHQAFQSENLHSYRPMLTMKARQLLKNLIHSPTDRYRHFNTYSTAVAMAVTYDYHPSPQNDPMVTNLRNLEEISSHIMGAKTSAILCAFPFLVHVPRWFPGAFLQRAAFEGQKLTNWWLKAPLQHVKERIEDQKLAPCILGEALSRANEKQTDAANTSQLIEEIALSSLLAAGDTTDVSLQVFLLVMVLYPDVQKRAQAEIQAVVGTDRLPDFNDRPDMPYVEAVMRETLRWHPPLPCSVPRSVVKDDVYRGYHFPKGVTILPNIWGLAHDKTRYADPFDFNPGRFLDEEGKLNDDSVSYVFGFGRRICAGRIIAETSLWSAVAKLLAVFSFEAPLDEDGKPIKIKPSFTTGMTSHPEHFPCRITLRMEAQKLTSLLETDY